MPPTQAAHRPTVRGTTLIGWLGLGGFFAKRSTPTERRVIVWTLIILALGLGLVCLYFGFTAAPTKATEAAQLRLYGYGLLGAAFVIWLLHRLIAWCLDR